MRRTRERAGGARTRAARWWSRLAIGSAFTLTVAAPAVALADTATDSAGPSDASGGYSCVTMCGQPATPESSGATESGATEEDVRQAAAQTHAQSDYQLNASQPARVAPDRPSAQGYYQLGAGHRD